MPSGYLRDMASCSALEGVFGLFGLAVGSPPNFINTFFASVCLLGFFVLSSKGGASLAFAASSSFYFCNDKASVFAVSILCIDPFERVG